MNYTNHLNDLADDGQTISAAHKTFYVFWFGGNFVIIK